MLRYLVFPFLCIGAVLSFSVQTDDVQDGQLNTNERWPITPRLTSLGTVGLKTYYVDRLEGMNWQDARFYCEKMGMLHASVDDEEEQKFLHDAYQTGVFDYTYWVSGCDSRKLSQFNWYKEDGVRADVNLDIQLLFASDAYHLSCLAFAPSRPTLEVYDCTRATSIGVLCETTRTIA